MRGTLLTVTLLPLLACAQSWCAPGAEWVFSFGSQQASGVRVARYSGDTLIGNYTVQRIDQAIYATEVYAGYTGPPFTAYGPPLYTRYEDGIVYRLDEWTGSYDTLMWFSALPGDHWNHSGIGPGFGATFTVTDTGTTSIAGIPLRYLALQNDMFGPDTLWERIGFDKHYVDPLETMMIDYTTYHLRCYRDSMIDLFNGSYWSGTTCNFSVGSYEPTVPRSGIIAVVHPNPGTTQFTLTLPPGPHTITLFDAMGRIVLVQRTADERPVIGTEHLPAGVYRIGVRNDRGGVMGATWVKER